MTTFHSEAAKALVAGIIATWVDDWPDELETITGYTVQDYQELARRLENGIAQLTPLDRHMLRNAAAQFSGYPGISTRHCELSLGGNWREIVRTFLER